jgi:thermolysin
MVRTLSTTLVAAVAFLAPGASADAQQHPGLRRVTAGSIGELRQWDQRIDAMQRAGELRVRRTVADPDVAGRTHERATQHYKDVPVFGADVTRQLAAGQTVSVFGALYTGIDLDVTPRLDAEDAAAILEKLTGQALGPSKRPVLTILPREGGDYVLVWRARVATAEAFTLYFVDAKTGAIVKQMSDLKSQAAAIGKGVGVLGDTKKISASSQSGQYYTIDEMRPPQIVSFNMHGNVGRTLDFLNGRIGLALSDVGVDSDNDWSDGVTVDAHAYSGFTYDYFFKRHSRTGLDGQNIRMLSLVHPVNRQDLLSQPDEIVGMFYLNAFYAGDGVMVYGEGLPPGFVLLPFRQTVDYFAAGLDIIAHELAHGVTDFTSGFIYENESGALSEAFSDVMGVGVEFMFQAPGSGLRQADYAVGEDVIRPGGIRNLANPAALGDPDHYSRRFTGPEDNGGVHLNATIPGHAFYLAIEGGTNRTSGQSVTGVGAGNREQMEKVFYRAFTMLMPASSNFSTARAATIQAARDLYGGGSPAERAVTQAWSAVGVD